MYPVDLIWGVLKVIYVIRNNQPTSYEQLLDTDMTKNKTLHHAAFFRHVHLPVGVVASSDKLIVSFTNGSDGHV